MINPYQLDVARVFSTGVLHRCESCKCDRAAGVILRVGKLKPSFLCLDCSRRLRRTIKSALEKKRMRAAIDHDFVSEGPVI